MGLIERPAEVIDGIATCTAMDFSQPSHTTVHAEWNGVHVSSDEGSPACHEVRVSSDAVRVALHNVLETSTQVQVRVNDVRTRSERVTVREARVQRPLER